MSKKTTFVVETKFCTDGFESKEFDKMSSASSKYVRDTLSALKGTTFGVGSGREYHVVMSRLIVEEEDGNIRHDINSGDFQCTHLKEEK